MTEFCCRNCHFDFVYSLQKQTTYYVKTFLLIFQIFFIHDGNMRLIVSVPSIENM